MKQLSQYANTKVKKNRIAPLLTFMIAGSVASLLITFSMMLFMLSLVAQNQIKGYDTLADMSVSSLELEFDQTFGEMSTFVNSYKVDSFANFWRKLAANLSEELTLVKQYNNYTELMVIDKTGIGFDSGGNAVDISREVFFSQLSFGKRSLIPSGDGELSFIFSVPLTDIRNDVIGMFIVKKSAILGKYSSSANIWGNNKDIYILDMNDDIVGMGAYGDYSFDFTEASVYDSEKNISLFSAASDYLGGSSTSDFAHIFGEGGTNIWFVKDLKYNNWRLYLGRDPSVGNESEAIISAVYATFGIQISFIVVILFIFTALQINSNKKLLATLYLDTITGKTNWVKFKIDSSKMLKSKRAQRRQRYFVDFDIMQFSVFCEMYGNEKGDTLLIFISDVLNGWTKKDEVFTRKSADCFNIIMFARDNQEAEQRLKLLQDTIGRERGLEKLKLSFGVYHIEEKQNDVEKMYLYATFAKDTVSPTSENRIAFYDERMREKILKEKKLEGFMERALANREFVVYLQPKYSTGDEKLSGAEALVRWISTDMGFISPGEFIPLFEKNGFIVKLDDYMLSEVCALQRRWLDAGHELVTISVNISRANFSNPILADKIKSIVDNYGVPYQYIELELTESAFFDDKKILLDTVDKLRDFGFKVSMDDFGSGYSSLNSLKDLPLDVIKLDGEFFHDTRDQERGKTVIRDTIALAKDLKMKVVAEGIETREQVDFLGELGCDLIQGFYFSKPVPVSEFEKLSRYRENRFINN